MMIITTPPLQQSRIFSACAIFSIAINQILGSPVPVVISGFRSVKRMRVWLPLDGRLIRRRLAPSRSWYSFYRPRIDRKLISQLWRKEGYTNFQHSRSSLTVENLFAALSTKNVTDCNRRLFLVAMHNQESNWKYKKLRRKPLPTAKIHHC